jgi:hypothetical protein
MKFIYHEFEECFVFTPPTVITNSVGDKVRIFSDLCTYSEVLENKKNDDCPICFEPIENTNNITTECGHKFHANCLLQNVSLNGYSCPCCRTQMIQGNSPQYVSVSDDDTFIEDYDDNDDLQSFTVYPLENDQHEHEHEHEDYIGYDREMQSFRWFHQRIHNQELEGDPQLHEETIETERMINDDESFADEINKRHIETTINYIRRKNVTYEDLLSAFIHSDRQDFAFSNSTPSAYKKCCGIIENVMNEQFRI